MEERVRELQERVGHIMVLVLEFLTNKGTSTEVIWEGAREIESRLAFLNE